MSSIDHLPLKHPNSLLIEDFWANSIPTDSESVIQAQKSECLISLSGDSGYTKVQEAQIKAFVFNSDIFILTSFGALKIFLSLTEHSHITRLPRWAITI